MKAGYVTSKGAKKDDGNPNSAVGNTKKGVKATKGSNYLTLYIKKVFTFLQYAFTQVSILQHFDLERHIQIDTNVSSYAIGRILSQLTLDNLD